VRFRLAEPGRAWLQGALHQNAWTARVKQLRRANKHGLHLSRRCKRCRQRCLGTQKRQVSSGATVSGKPRCSQACNASLRHSITLPKPLQLLSLLRQEVLANRLKIGQHQGLVACRQDARIGCQSAQRRRNRENRAKSTENLAQGGCLQTALNRLRRDQNRHPRPKIGGAAFPPRRRIRL
jgi:hypothetical protein